MLVGVPTEVKNHEYRVAITRPVCTSSPGTGIPVLVESGAGLGSSITDREFLRRGDHCPRPGGRGKG